MALICPAGCQLAQLEAERDELLDCLEHILLFEPPDGYEGVWDRAWALVRRSTSDQPKEPT